MLQIVIKCLSLVWPLKSLSIWGKKCLTATWSNKTMRDKSSGANCQATKFAGISCCKHFTSFSAKNFSRSAADFMGKSVKKFSICTKTLWAKKLDRRICRNEGWTCGFFDCIFDLAITIRSALPSWSPVNSWMSNTLQSGGYNVDPAVALEGVQGVQLHPLNFGFYVLSHATSGHVTINNDLNPLK